jgi:two-component system OmpR family sensor kinase
VLSVSLRARLVATLLALSAAALLVLGGITYASQRSFEEQRIDDQTRAAQPAVEHAMADQFFGEPDEPRGGPRPPGPQANLPPGTYGQLRGPNGNVLDQVALTYGEDALSPPDLPARMTPGQEITVDSKDGSLSYRARAAPTRGGAGLTIVAIPLNGVEERLDRLLLVEGLVIVGVLLLLAAVSWLLVGVGLRPLGRIGETADAIAAGDLSRRVDVATPKTEVGRLGLAFNAMLERLEEAFRAREASEGRLRRFLADVSHELRTPLASIRGYSELFRIGAAREPEDADRAMTRIEEEAARMGVLVEDLLTLARLDEVRDRPAEAVDVAQLAQDAAADARAVDPARAIEVESDGEAIVLGDPNQLRQVLANLLGNALVHTPSGTPIEIAVRPDTHEVEIEVRDRGPGLPTDQPDELFERFWRARAEERERGAEAAERRAGERRAGGRSAGGAPKPAAPDRGRSGAGLGLAIVAGIVAAHHGSVLAGNAPGGGASFVVSLPLAGAPEDGAPTRTG